MEHPSKNRQWTSEIVLHSDERQSVGNTRRPPFRWICSLEVEFPEPVLYALGPLEKPGSNWESIKPSVRGCGTGLLIAPQKVLTAAHVVTGLKIMGRDRRERPIFRVISAKKVWVIPGRNEDDPRNPRPFGQFLGKQINIHRGYQKLFQSPVGIGLRTIKRALSRDIGLIELAKRPGKHPGWWGRDRAYQIPSLTKSLRRGLHKGIIHLAGYPGDKGRISCGSLYYSTDQVVSAYYRLNGQLQNLLLYQADTFAGMSGSPVWVRGKGGNFLLVGVHSSFIGYKAPFTKRIKQINVGGLIVNRQKNKIK